MSSFVYYTCKIWFLKRHRSSYYMTTWVTVFIWENFMHVIFSLFSLCLFLITPQTPLPPPLLFRCVTWIKESYLFLWNVVDNQFQAGSSRCREWEPCRLIHKQNRFCWTIKEIFICIDWKSEFWRLVRSYVHGCSSLHTCLLHSKHKHLMHLIPLLFFPRWGCQPWENYAFD